MKRLVLGSGLLGTKIISLTGWKYINRSEDNFNFLESNSYYPLLLKHKPEEVINCIAYTKTLDDLNSDLHWNTNYVGVIDLVDMCNALDIKLTHISTDYVYANSKPHATEENIPVHYDNWYTYTKLLADAYIQAKCEKYLILRSSFKPNPFPHKEAWIDLIGNFDYVDVIAKLMIKVIKKDAIGIYNIGTELKTIYDMAKETNPNVLPIQKDYRFIDSNDISMDITKMKELFKKSIS